MSSIFSRESSPRDGNAHLLARRASCFATITSLSYTGCYSTMENPHEERQNALLERIIKNVDLLADAMSELDRGVREINDYNRDISITGELWEGVSGLASDQR